MSIGKAGFFRIQVAFAIALLAIFVAFEPPALRSAVERPEPRVEALASVSRAQTFPALTGGIESKALPQDQLIPRTRSVVDVRLGPSSSQAIIGLVPRDAAIEVVGRDESGAWIAIVFTPGSQLHGWIERDKVAHLRDASSLPVATVTRLGTR